MNSLICVSVVISLCFAIVKCTVVQSPTDKEYPTENIDNGRNEVDIDKQSRLLELLYSLLSKHAAEKADNPESYGNDQKSEELYREARRFQPIAANWQRLYKPRKRAPCLLNAGLSHGCDVMDFLAAKHQQSKFADFAGPGKKRR